MTAGVGACTSCGRGGTGYRNGREGPCGDGGRDETEDENRTFLAQSRPDTAAYTPLSPSRRYRLLGSFIHLFRARRYRLVIFPELGSRPTFLNEQTVPSILVS